MSAAFQLWTLDRRGAPEFVGPMPDLPTARRCWRALSQAVVIGAGGRVVDERGDLPRADLERVRAAARARSADATPVAVAAEVVAAAATTAAAATAREEAAVAELVDAPGRPETSTDVPPPVAVADEAPSAPEEAAPYDVAPAAVGDDVVAEVVAHDVEPAATEPAAVGDDVVADGTDVDDASAAVPVEVAGGTALEAAVCRRAVPVEAPMPADLDPALADPLREARELGEEAPKASGATCPVKDCEEPPAGTWSPGHPRRCDELLVGLCRRHRVNAGVRHRTSGASLASIVQTMIEAGDSARFVRAVRPPILRRAEAPEEDPLAELRAVGARLATHRELLDAADALSPADRAMVVALARRLAGRAR